MPRRLTIVVTCTDRKSMPTSPEHRLRTLRSCTTAERFERWRLQLATSAHRKSLRRLYQGEAWSQVPALEAAAVKAGFEPAVYVASAGIGLRHIDEPWPAYAATFSSGNADSVPGDGIAHRDWWDALNSDSPYVETLSSSQDPVLMVLSPRYTNVLGPAIHRLADVSDLLVVGGSEAVPAQHRLPADGALRASLGGSMNSINIRMAVEWLRRLEKAELNSTVSGASWAEWANRVRKPTTYSRAVLGDDEVRSFIEQVRRSEPLATKTRTLRQLRNSGYACEQRRFSELFESTKEVAVAP